MSINPSSPKTTHYDILQLPRPSLESLQHGKTQSTLSKDDIKAAYRRALLIHHPDKIKITPTISAHQNHVPTTQTYTSTSTLNSASALTAHYTVDEIVAAYNVLLDPVRRSEYDHALMRQDKDAGLISDVGTGSHIGVEVFDLEDLDYNQADDTWSRACRCGDLCGYLLTENDLERESQHAEIYVGCRGCSLFIKVLFAVQSP
ncbi:hypothetical protein B0A52_08779 [Exophiala mesophila]|uniref:Diphthamide biosynthesis protein 4 n=1 Tax=Exophiala mesophila TaxID=212818 RepID=A0A438MWB8_EXOME|nr:hypothetical protein B0A52_08779 [Exophiala mesophila]